MTFIGYSQYEKIEQKRTAAIKEAREHFEAAAAEHGLTVAVSDGILGERFELFDPASNAPILTVQNSSYGNRMRLTASGSLLPQRRVRNRLVRELWRSKPRDLFEAVKPYLRTLTHVERAERDRKEWLKNHRPPIYRGQRPARGSYPDEMKACIIPAHWSEEDAEEIKAIRDRIRQELDANLSDDLIAWLIDTSFRPALDRAQELDAKSDPTNGRS